MASLLVMLMASVGYGIANRPAGIIMDSRNKISLSRFQMAGWTVVVLASILTIAITNTAAMTPCQSGAVCPSPLDFTIPDGLLAAMGISSASMIASPFILNTKTTTDPHPDQVSQTADKLNIPQDSLINQGMVFARSNAMDASWLDMFRGDDVATAWSVDLSKIQQFLITLVLLGSYSVSVMRLLVSSDHIPSMPVLSEGFIWLMSISHGSYLAFKSLPQSNTSPVNKQNPTTSPPVD
ncbi:MAG: hypothetical protein G8345_02875 [Magnetococcales bacterium]|nr:hypothetical protein [Magnetococcales bacterium]NGZ25816.1 hypothetical protein [Magnetococcales bacterium]